MKRIYTCLVISALTIVLYACKKELSALPKNAKVDANTILDQGTAQIALNGAYYAFANATAAQTGWQNHQTVPGMFSGYVSYGYSTMPEEENKNSSITSYYWSESYILLNAANGVIKGVNALSDNKFTGSRKKEIIGEAHFLRAYAHFKLLTYYGEWYKADSPFGILLRDELSTLGNIVKERSTVKESYDFILADLDDAIANGPAANPNVYATKWAAMALKMRVLISRGTTADYAALIELANNLIQNSPFALEAKAEDIFHKNGLSSKEVILGIRPQAGQELNAYSKSRQYWPGASYLYTATGALKNIFSPDDPRQAWIIGSTNTNSLRESYFLTKYISEGSTPTVVSETDYAIRLTEVYLLKAEAIVRSGGSLTDAKAVIHQVQEKAGITATVNNTAYLAVESANTADALVMEIYKETVKSLVAEDGLEWLALLRLPFDTVKQLKPTIASQTQYILPVPKTEFVYNPSFGLQNPGYSRN